MKIIMDEELLLSVEKPSRYVGNEWNSVKKSLDGINIRFAFCFPDIYEIGMSHLGMKILYHLLNERKDTYCERVFAPWVDMETKMRQNEIPLFSLETKEPINKFDFIGFTLQYEMSYTNIINMINLSGVPVLSSDRTEEHPFVCAGGPCSCNPEPLADIVDFFMLGEGEEIINEVMDVYIVWKTQKGTRIDFLERIIKIEGVYVPQFYEVEYNLDGTINSILPKNKNYPVKIKKRIIKDLDTVYFPEKVIVPFTDIVHNRIMLELFRGCIRGCRFCQAGFIYRPVRERTTKKLVDLANKLVNSTGYEEISLTSLSTSDYPDLECLTGELISDMEKRKVNLSLPSLRIDSFSIDLIQKVQKVRKSGLTFAPEAGTQRLRDIINKGVTEENLLNSVSTAFNNGWNTVKLYFMIGLPREKYSDVEEISVLSDKVVGTYMDIPKGKRGKGLSVTISTSSFVPKPFTPFQWEAQDKMEELRDKQRFLKSKIKNRYITYNWHDSELSFLEGIFARGDRKIGQVLIKAWEKGCKFDSWGEHFKFKKWMEAFDECGVDPYFYTNRKRTFEEVFPWEHIDVGVSKEFLILENQKAYKGETTKNCRESCSSCGITNFGGDACFE